MCQANFHELLKVRCFPSLKHTFDAKKIRAKREDSLLNEANECNKWQKELSGIKQNNNYNYRILC